MFKKELIFKIIIFILIIVITATCLFMYFSFIYKPKDNLQSYFPRTTETLKYVGAFGYNYYINLATINTNESNIEYIFTGKALENIVGDVDSNALRIKIRYILQGDSIVEYFDTGDLMYQRFKKLTILKTNLETGDTWTENTTLLNDEPVLVEATVLSVENDMVLKYVASKDGKMVHEEVRTYRKGKFLMDIKYTIYDENGEEDYSYRIFRSN